LTDYDQRLRGQFLPHTAPHQHLHINSSLKTSQVHTLNQHAPTILTTNIYVGMSEKRGNFFQNMRTM